MSYIEELQKKLGVLHDRRPLEKSIEKLFSNNHPSYEEFSTNIKELMKFTTWTQCGVELNSLIMIRSYDKEANFYNEKLLTTM